MKLCKHAVTVKGVRWCMNDSYARCPKGYVNCKKRKK